MDVVHSGLIEGTAAGAGSKNIIRWCSPTPYHSESGRSLLPHRVTDFDAKPTLGGDAPLYRFCESSFKVSIGWKTAIRSSEGHRVEARGFAGRDEQN
jgi:hypothetical protein